ncbi:SAMC2 [Symbiodinium natans]|uniref:SAMC2 protein n=1 Tax=Symbiodinium natans TaxID=878477 RepID=A0A812S469_9DINO|nr:SAMC2 [Symbiodinium natans]
MDMLSSMDNMVQEVVAPVIHKMQPASMAPLSCQQEVASLCPKARSQVHCLGQNSGAISDNCRRDVGKSVPFLCSGAIDKYCDILKAGILDCLHQHMGDVAGDCKDAILATSKAITALNTVNAATPVPQALLARPVVASGGGASADRERTLDSKLAGLTTKAPSVVSMIKEAEKQAEDQLAKDADKIESLLSQMSEKMVPKPSAASHLVGHSSHSWILSSANLL